MREHVAKNKNVIIEHAESMGIRVATAVDWNATELAWELAQAKYVLDGHCGSFLQDVSRWPSRTWEGASVTPSWTWA
jgi:hypothetical protein